MNGEKIIPSVCPEDLPKILDEKMAHLGLGQPGEILVDGEVSPHFFGKFRPLGEKVAAVLPPLHPEVLQRLLTLFEVTAPHFQRNGYEDVYFVVRTRNEQRDSQLEVWAEGFLRNMLALGEELQEGWDGEFPEILVHRESGPTTSEPSSFEDYLYELTAGVLEMLDPEDGFEALMDPLYYTACQTPLSAWVIWPVLAKDFKVEDPFRPYFELWRNGYELVWEGEELLGVWEV